MTFLLSAQNVFDYLVRQGLCTQEEQALSKIERKPGKNFNLLLSLPDDRQILIKQEPHREGKSAGGFLKEWRVQEFLQLSPLNYIRPYLPEVLHFDESNSIIVFNYLKDYQDLINFYTQENDYPTAIATAIGTVLATIHRVTLDRQDYRDFFSLDAKGLAVNRTAALSHDLKRISPEVFGVVPADGFKFFALYQRYDSLGQAIEELGTAVEPCCLTHNDLKLNNILLSVDWEQVVVQTERSSLVRSSHSQAEPGKERDREDGIVRLIDWENSNWGDPAFDLGTIIASYLQIWLASLVTSKAIAIEESLRLAMTPLEELQPSITALTRAYLANFPQILERNPDFLQRVMQFSGLSLIFAIRATLQHQKFFGNQGICMLQVAKTLLCRPEQSMLTVFGVPASALTPFSFSPT